MVRLDGAAAWIVRENAFDVERLGDDAVPGGGVSVTPTVNLKVPLVVGVPLSVPVVESKVRPGGAGLMNQTYVPAGPSVALKVTE